jgi:hypothetical protein
MQSPPQIAPEALWFLAVVLTGSVCLTYGVRWIFLASRDPNRYAAIVWATLGAVSAFIGVALLYGFASHLNLESLRSQPFGVWGDADRTPYWPYPNEPDAKAFPLADGPS